MTNVLPNIDDRLAEIVREIDVLVAEREQLMTAKRVMLRFAADAAPEKADGTPPAGGQPAIPPAPNLPDHISDAPKMVEAHPDQPVDLPSAKPSLASRLRSLFQEHPEYTAAKVAEVLEETKQRVASNSAVIGLRWAKSERSVSPPPADHVDSRIVALHDDNPTWTPAMLARRLGLATVAVSMRAKRLKLELPSEYVRDGERPPIRKAMNDFGNEDAERTTKRDAIAALHDAEPWLTPDEAAARLLIPVVNLRIFSGELEIEWSQPRETSPIPAPSEQPQMLSVRSKVFAMHRHHPNWTAKIIADSLGAKVSTVSVYLAEARQSGVAA